MSDAGGNHERIKRHECRINAETNRRQESHEVESVDACLTPRSWFSPECPRRRSALSPWAF